MSRLTRSLAAVAAVLSLSYAALGTAGKEPVYRVISVPDAETLRTLEHGRVRFAITAAPEVGGRARCPREEARAVEARDCVRTRTATVLVTLNAMRLLAWRPPGATAA